MRNFQVFVLLLFSIYSYSQYSEFTIYDNGLIYSDATIAPLKSISDSLNNEFKECSIHHNYQSLRQTIGHYVQLDTGQILEAKADMDKGMALSEFVKKYPDARVEKELFVVQFPYTDRKGVAVVDFNEIEIDKRWGYSIEDIPVEDVLEDYSENWVYNYIEKNEYFDASINAFYFPKSFSTKPIPANFARMIGYSNCMIDTTSSKIAENAEYGHIDLPEDWQDHSLEAKNTMLNKFRHTRVTGSCSMDATPRIHARNIALLSSEVANWNVFLKAHLDILNDHFERSSDGSYAWEGRKTYLKELEALDINTLELLMGITFRVSKESKHHYYGSPGRIGRALVDSKDKIEVERLLVEIIENEELDDFNRLLGYYTFKSYIYNLTDQDEKAKALIKVKKASLSMPDYINKKMVFDK